MTIQPPALPPLEPGDHLTRDEFERRYDAMPNLKKAELIVEVSASRVSIDRNARLRVYEHAGVREYIIWRVLEQEVDWYVLRGGQYQPLAPGADGVYRSEVFPGLWLARAALVGRDLAALLAVLQQGLASPEHAAFVAALQQHATHP